MSLRCSDQPCENLPCDQRSIVCGESKLSLSAGLSLRPSSPLERCGGGDERLETRVVDTDADAAAPFSAGAGLPSRRESKRLTGVGPPLMLSEAEESGDERKSTSGKTVVPALVVRLA